MGTGSGRETWTSIDDPTRQNSWFQNRDERVLPNDGNNCHSTENKVVRKPFIKVFYGSLTAGGQFGDGAEYDSCGENFVDALGGNRPDTSFIAGHAEGTNINDIRGSSVQYALQANNIINGFYSASQRRSSPTPLKGLTLSNKDSTLAYGGGFGKKTCIANYWREVEKLDEDLRAPDS